MTNITIESAVEEFLFGPTIDDLQAMIEPNGARRLVKQADCRHARRDWLHGLCVDCGMTDELWREIETLQRATA